MSDEDMTREQLLADRERLLAELDAAHRTISDLRISLSTAEAPGPPPEKFARRRLLDQCSDAIYLIDAAGQIVDANKAACAAMGKSLEEMLGLGVWEVDTNFTQEGFIAFWADKPDNESTLIESTHRRADGSSYPVEISIRAFTENGERFFYGVARDITERKQAESESDAILAAAFDGFLLVSNKGRVLRANQTAATMLGYEIEELSGLGMWMIDATESQADTRRRARRLVVEGGGLFETRMRRKDGGVIDVEVSAFYLERDAGGRFAVFIRDITERKRIEYSLQLTQASVDKAALSIFWIDPEGRFLYANDTACARLGYSREELLGMGVSDVDIDYPKQTRPEVWRRYKDQKSVKFETRHRAKDGRILPMLVTSNYLAFDDQEFEFAYAEDISELKTMQQDLLDKHEELEGERAKLGLAMDLAGMASWEMDVGTQTFTFDERFFSLYGTTAEREGGWTMSSESYIHEFVHPEDVGMVAAEIRKPLETEGQDFEGRMEHRIVRRDGQVRHISVQYRLFRDSEGRPVKTIGADQDITERKQAEIELKESELRFKALHNASFGGIAIHDKGVILDCNQGLSEITGYAQEELIGMDGLLLIAEQSRAEVRRNILDGFEKPYEVFGVRKNGEEYPLRLEARNIPYKGKPVRVVEFRDITERRRAEQEQASLKARLQALWHVSRMVEASYTELCDLVLEEIQSLTGSQYSFFGFIDEDESAMSIHSWSQEAKSECSVVDGPLHFPIDQAGVWARAVVERRPVIINDYELTTERKRGIPAGHVPIRKLLAVPFLRHGKAVAIAAVANKSAEYTNDDMAQVNAFVTSVMILLDKRRVENELAASEERLALALDTVNEGVWDWRVDTGAVYFNSVWYTMLGYQPDELPQEFETWRKLVHPEDLPGAEEVIAESLKVAEPFDMEFRMRTKSGEWRWINSRGRVVEQDAAGRAVRMLGTHMDVTERRQAEESLRKSEEKFRNFFEYAGEGIFLSDMSSTILDANPAAADILGYRKPEDLVGIKARDLIHPDDLKTSSIATRRKQAQEGGLVQTERRYRRADGAYIPVDVTVKFLRDTGVHHVIFRDITARKRTEEALIEAKEQAEAANRAKSEFLANMSHEIRTPLNGVMGMLQLMKTTTLDPEQQEYATAAIQSSKRLTRLLSDILDLSRVEAGRLEIAHEPVDVSKTMRQVEELFAPITRQSEVAFASRVSPDIPERLLGDAARLQQVLGNLVGNAFKFTSQGCVTVEAAPLPSPRSDGCRVLFSVSDTGVGIPDDKLGVLFEPFTQAVEGFTRQYQGAGLGLSICKRLVELMGGNISVESEEGKGTTFYPYNAT